MPPKNNMGLAVTALVLGFIAGCFPVGVFAVFNAAQVNTKYQRGDTAGAEKAARSARTLSLVSFVLSALAVVLIVVYIVALAGDSTTTST